MVSTAGDFEITANQESRGDLLCIPVFSFGEPLTHFDIRDAWGEVVVSARCGDGFVITGIQPNDYSSCLATMEATGYIADTGQGEDADTEDTAMRPDDAGPKGSNLCTCETLPGYQSYGEECAGDYEATATSSDGRTATINYSFKWTPKHSKGFFGCS